MERDKLTKLVIIFVAIFSVGISAQQLFNINFDNLGSWINSFGIISPAIFSFLLFLGLSIPFNPLPDYLLVSLAAYLFTPYQAIAATFLAHTLAITVNFYFAQKLGAFFFKKLLNRKEEISVKKFSSQITLPRIFSMRFILPLTAIGIDVVSYASGIAKVSFLKFYIASIIPWTILSVIFFTSASYLKEISAGLILVPGIILAVISLSIVYLAKKIS